MPTLSSNGSLLSLDTPLSLVHPILHNYPENQMSETAPTTRDADSTRDSLLAMGLQYARASHYSRIPLKQICMDIGKSHTLIIHHFGTAAAFRDEVLRRAIVESDLAVLAQGLADRNPVARGAPAKLRKQALDSLLS